MTDQFDTAANWLRVHAPPNLPNATKLRLYALFKVASTATSAPPTPRPSLWEFEGRAKWDSWARVGKELKEGDEAEDEVVGKAREQYLKLAREQGWEEQSGPGDASGDNPAGEVSGVTPAGPAHQSGGGGMVVMSQMDDDPIFSNRTAPAPGASRSLHDLALDGDDEAIAALSSDELEKIDVINEDGYTPLHLAADLGRTSTVTLLLKLGANTNIKDDDDLTAEQLAREAGWAEVAKLLEKCADTTPGHSDVYAHAP